MSSKKREMLIKRGDDTFARILAHHTNPEAFPLSEKEQEQLDRWYEAFTMMLNHFSRLAIVKVWTDKKGLSVSQAYADIKNAELLFGNVMKADKEAGRALWTEWCLDLLKRSKQKGDRKAEAKAMDMLAKYAGYGVEDQEQFNPEKLANVELQLSLPASQIEILQEMANKGVVDFNKLNVVEAEYTEVNDEDAAPE